MGRRHDGLHAPRAGPDGRGVGRRAAVPFTPGSLTGSGGGRMTTELTMLTLSAVMCLLLPNVAILALPASRAVSPGAWAPRHAGSPRAAGLGRTGAPRARQPGGEPGRLRGARPDRGSRRPERTASALGAQLFFWGRVAHSRLRRRARAVADLGLRRRDRGRLDDRAAAPVLTGPATRRPLTWRCSAPRRPSRAQRAALEPQQLEVRQRLRRGGHHLEAVVGLMAKASSATS